jgi:hypothetical protein
MRFGEALELCRQGERIYRTGWNGKDQFVYYQAGNILPLDYYCRPIREWAYKKGFAVVETMGHFDIKTTANVIQCGWLATQSDMQADDWEVFE